MADFQRLKQKLKRSFHDVSDIGEWVECPFRVESGISSPPSYMARMALLVVGDFTDCGPSDKVQWTVFVTYKGVVFEVRDWKGATWTIEASVDTLEAEMAGRELKRKICQVASGLDKALSEELRERITSTEFVLNNPYSKIRFAYEWFRDKAESSPVDFDDEEISTAVEVTAASINRLLNLRARGLTERVLNGYAMVGLYYSSLEFLLNVFYAFADRGLGFLAFRKSSWRERFLAVMPVSKRPDLARLYEKLLHLKANFRDELFHGLGGAENLLVELSGVGLVPISYEALTCSIHFSSLIMDATFVDEALEIFDEFDAWLESNPPWSCYVQYVESGLEIPFYGKQLEEVRRAIAYPDDFDRWLEKELAYRDYLAG